MKDQACPNCDKWVVWDTAHEPHAWRHDHDSRWCESVGGAASVYPDGATNPNRPDYKRVGFYYATMVAEFEKNRQGWLDILVKNPDDLVAAEHIVRITSTLQFIRGLRYP